MIRALTALLAALTTACAAPQAASQPLPTLAELGLQGRDAASGAPRHLVVFLHGFGSNGTDFEAIAGTLAADLPDTVFLYPDAPTPEPSNTGRPGFTWYEFAGGRAAQSRDAAVAYVAGQVETVREAYGLDAPIVIAGFSQGAGTAVQLALCSDVEVEAVLALGGLVDTACPRDPGPVVRFIHMEGDPRIPLDWAETSVGLVEAEGHQPVLEVFPGDSHWPGPAAWRAAADFLIAEVRD